MDQNQQGGNQFVPGLRLFRRDNAPAFVMGQLKISVDELIQFVQNNPQAVEMYNGQRQISVDLLWSKQGKPYCALNTYRSAAPAQGAPASAPGYPPQYPQQPAPAGYPPAQPQYPQQPQAPQYPQAPAAPAQAYPAPPAQQYPPVQQPYGPQQPQQPGQYQAPPQGDMPF